MVCEQYDCDPVMLPEKIATSNEPLANLNFCLFMSTSTAKSRSEQLQEWKKTVQVKENTRGKEIGKEKTSKKVWFR